jgi:hypothetical protein
MSTNVSEKRTTVPSSALNIEATGSSEMVVIPYQITLCQNLQHLNPNFRLR